MKKIIWMTVVISFFFSACQKEEEKCEESHKAACCAGQEEEQDLNAESLSDLSVYHLSSEWIKQDGEKIKLESFQGKPQIIALIYTSCSYACPRIISDLKGIEEKLSEDAMENYGILLVSMDPEIDTPEKLKNFAEENKMDAKKWSLLNGNSEDIRELAILLNVKYKRTATGDISHSNIISVLNEKGEVVYQEEGLGVDSEGTVKAVKNLLKAKD